jgi:hypothetical protein
MGDAAATWEDISRCPDDFKRPGGQRKWRLLLRPNVQPGRVYSLTGSDAVPEPEETIGRRGYFNNSGWVEAETNREIWPTHFAPLP